MFVCLFNFFVPFFVSICGQMTSLSVCHSWPKVVFKPVHVFNVDFDLLINLTFGLQLRHLSQIQVDYLESLEFIFWFFHFQR